MSSDNVSDVQPETVIHYRWKLKKLRRQLEETPETNVVARARLEKSIQNLESRLGPLIDAPLKLREGAKLATSSKREEKRKAKEEEEKKLSIGSEKVVEVAIADELGIPHDYVLRRNEKVFWSKEAVEARAKVKAAKYARAEQEGTKSVLDRVMKEGEHED